jgi:hypothetical protein
MVSLTYEVRKKRTMDATNQEEKRESVRAALRAEVQFSVMEAHEYEAVKDQIGLQGCVGRGPFRASIQPGIADASEGALTGDTAPEADLIGFLIQIDEKLDRILNMLTKKDICNDLPVYVGEGLDISGSGMRLLSEENIEPGKVLDTRFQISRYPAVLLQVYGKVVRTRSMDRHGKPGYEIALAFLDLDESYKEWIISYVFQIQREAIRSEKKGENE